MHRIFSRSYLAWIGVIGGIFTALSDFDKILKPLGILGSYLPILDSWKLGIYNAFYQMTGIKIWSGNVAFVLFIASILLIATGLRAALRHKLHSSDYNFEEWLRLQTVSQYARQHYGGAAKGSSEAWHTYAPLYILFALAWISGWITVSERVQLNQGLLRSLLLILGMLALIKAKEYLQRPFISTEHKKTLAAEKRWAAKLSKAGVSAHAFSEKGVAAHDEMPEVLRNYYRNAALVEFLQGAFALCIWFVITGIAILCAAAYVAKFGASFVPVVEALAIVRDLLAAFVTVLVVAPTLPSASDNIASVMVGVVSGAGLGVAKTVRGSWAMTIRAGLVAVALCFVFLPLLRELGWINGASSAFISYPIKWSEAILAAPLPFLFSHLTISIAFDFLQRRIAGDPSSNGSS